MPIFSTESIRGRAGNVHQVFTVIGRQPSWVLRIAFAAAALTLVAIAALLVIPALLIGLLAFFAAAVIARVRAWTRSLRAPNGALDGRQNVRVILPESRERADR